MSEIFSFKRFGTYFKYDLFSARANYGQSLLISGLTPVWVFICYELLSLLSGKGWSQMDDGLQITALIIALALLLMAGPVKMYGSLTEKRSGASWLMIPASTFEKFLSMVVIVCILLPAAGFILVFGSDALLSLLPGYGESLLAVGDKVAAAEEINPGEVFTPLALWASWCESALAFTLGAVCFKKAKAGKTILCLIGVGILFSAITMLVFQSPNITSEQLFDFFGGNPDKALKGIKTVLTLIYVVVISGLLGGLFFRLKTLRH